MLKLPLPEPPRLSDRRIDQPFLLARRDDFVQQLKRQLLPLTIGVENELIDWQPAFGIKLHANHFWLMPEHEA
jgi:hypothetical protein